MTKETKRVHTLIGFILLIIMITISGVIFQPSKAFAAKGYPYLIKVNKSMNCVTVYERDKQGEYTVPVKAMVCSVGLDTPLGNYKIPSKYRWRLMVDDVWSQYATRITGGILFHSVWYYKQDASTLSATQYNKLGTTCSHGCVRLTCEDAKWIYDNCPIGTSVVIYEDKVPGPLGKPSAIKLKPGTGWDPTDTSNPNNPFNDKKPTIKGAKNKTVKYLQKVDLKKGITALSTTGFDITKSIEVKGKVNTKIAGKYEVTYRVKDLLGRTDKKTITYTVLENPDASGTTPKDTTAPIISGVRDLEIAWDQKVDTSFALEGVGVSDDDKSVTKEKIIVTITQLDEVTYSILYEVKDLAGNKASVTATFVVTDFLKITGAKNKTIALDTNVNEEYVLSSVYAYNGEEDISDCIEVSIVEKENIGYEITYTVTDEYEHVEQITVLYKFRN